MNIVSCFFFGIEIAQIFFENIFSTINMNENAQPIAILFKRNFSEP